MEFTALQGVMFAASLLAGITFSIPAASPESQVSLSNPEIISSYNLPEETAQPESIQNLNSLTQPVTDKLQMIVKEVKADEVVTVEQPPVIYTVMEPTPKPSPKPEESEGEAEGTDKSKTKTAQAEEKKTESKTEDKKPEPSPSATPTPTPTPAPGTITSANAEILFNMTNDYRAKMGKPAFEKEDRLCKIAEQRAPQVRGELASGTLHKGFKDLNLPYWATENIAAYSTMQENFNFLSTDYIHRKAIESDHKYSCTACTGTSCSQIFSSFVSK